SSLIITASILFSVIHAQQIADPNFDAKVAHPAYAKNGPKVLFDEAHNNFHTASGRYKPFADLITNDGYQVMPNKQKFSAETLKGPADSAAFLKLADSAEDAMPGVNPNPASAAGRAQGLTMSFGKGRVVVLGEAAMLSAQLGGPNQMPFGMNRPGIDNRQL